MLYDIGANRGFFVLLEFYLVAPQWTLFHHNTDFRGKLYAIIDAK
jgi:hypothetical protein